MDKKIVDKKSFAEQIKSRVEERLGADCRCRLRMSVRTMVSSIQDCVYQWIR